MPIRIPVTPPNTQKLMGKLARGDSKRFAHILTLGLRPETNGDYLHWDDILHREPPSDLTREEWWTAVKIARRSSYRRVPLRDKVGAPFVYVHTDSMMQLLASIDRDASGILALPEEVSNPETKDRYVVNSLIEEAITSSQIEGAITTRKVAKDMIRSKRAPKTPGETMILNNFQAMRHIERLAQSEFTVERILELQHILTFGTLDNPSDVGRFRGVNDDIKVFDEDVVLHDPPNATEVPERIQALCDFANATNEDPYAHSVVRATILHFWLGYVHPFADGNGRTARALFYWSMLRSGYWLIQYVSISRLLRKAWAEYPRSFLYTETDDNDLTYFVLYQLRILRRAIDALHSYLRRKTREIRRIEAALRNSTVFNHRQLALIGHATKHPMMQYTISSHQNSHRVSYQTARTDLLGLETHGILQSKKVGKKLVFQPDQDLEAQLKSIDPN